MELKLDIKKQNIQVFNDVYDKEQAVDMVDAVKKKAFGVISGIMRAFEKDKNDIVISLYEKRYEPFWHVIGESYMEYLRQTDYGFEVKPEVRSVKIDKKVFPIDENSPFCRVSGEDHCVEKFEKSFLVDASDGKEKGLNKYMDFETYQIKETEELMNNAVVVPAQIRSSFLIRDLIKDLLKPIQADKVLQEYVEIKKLCLYFRPIHAFELTQTSKNTTRVLEVDALTGEITRGSVFKTTLKELVPEGALFDIGAELASYVIPGAALGAEISKVVRKKRKQKKAVAAMKKSKAAMDESKSKKKKKKSKKA